MNVTNVKLKRVWVSCQGNSVRMSLLCTKHEWNAVATSVNYLNIIEVVVFMSGWLSNFMVLVRNIGLLFSLVVLQKTNL